MDRSFNGLLISVVLHAIFLWILFMGKFSPPIVRQAPTEVTLIEKPKAEKHKGFVTETDLKPTIKELEDKAELLSQFTKRVKKQTRAARTDKTMNASPQPVQERTLKVGPVGGGQLAVQQQQVPSSDDQGLGMMRPGGSSSQAMKTLAIGQSALAEYIPGVQEGAFTSLNTDQFTYYTFFARMNEQVRNRWVSLVRSYVNSRSPQQLEQLSKQERQSLVEIILNPEGQFDSAVLHSSSGDQNLDRIPGQSFEIAAPFLNPPRGMIEGDGKIHLKYAFVLQFRPPSFGPVQN